MKIGEEVIVELISNEVELSKAQDALDLMGRCFPLGVKKIIIRQENIIPEFFDLKTGIAGEMLQKFVNYYFKVIIVGDYSKYTSNALKDFIYESNKQGEIIFISSLEEISGK
ncbi:MAG: DUF4180 domain-containing protein [Candidatus Pacebacteria bacterium]|nr:DUF4180 domain-containing protein [Candidatus Paceibacterota bacterium]